MNTVSCPFDAAILDLAAWCRLAHDMLHPSYTRDESTHLRTLKRQLQRLHRRHAAQLRRWTGENEIRVEHATHRPHAWSEVRAAINASDERVALAACALLQRAVLAAYDRAADRAWMNSEAMQLIQEQRREVAHQYATYSRRPAGAPAIERPRAADARLETTSELSRSLVS